MFHIIVVKFDETSHWGESRQRLHMALHKLGYWARLPNLGEFSFMAVRKPERNLGLGEDLINVELNPVRRDRCLIVCSFYRNEKRDGKLVEQIVSALNQTGLSTKIQLTCLTLDHDEVWE